MRKSFKGFYSPTEEQLDSAWRDQNTVFSFDTNTLLNLYGYASQTREDFFEILTHIADQLWMPYHVGLEYQRRRLSVVRREKAIFTEIEKLVGTIDQVFEKDFPTLDLASRFPELDKKTDELQKKVRASIGSYRRSLSHWDKKQPCVRGHDEIRTRLDEIFETKVGDKPSSQDMLDAIFEEGEARYTNRIPPGYKDAAKENDEQEVFSFSGLVYRKHFGDLLIWKQLIERAKSDDVNAVIFVTDDAKEDWWYTINSRGNKTVGPRAELREEICSEASIDMFAMYNTSDFLKKGKKLLEVDVKDESISETDSAFRRKHGAGSIHSDRLIEEIFGRQIMKQMSEAERLGAYSKNINRLRDEYSKYSSLAREVYGVSLSDLQNEYDRAREHMGYGGVNPSIDTLRRLEEIKKIMKEYKSSIDSDETDDRGPVDDRDGFDE